MTGVQTCALPIYRTTYGHSLVVNPWGHVIARAYDKPGFVTALKDLHPDLEPKCTTCHAPKGHGAPDGTNVSKEGRKRYQELMKQEQERNAKLPILPDATDHTTFVVFGDTRTNDSIHQEVVNGICQEAPQAVFHTGDVVASGSDTSLWANAMRIENCLIQPRILHTACGNHEDNFCTNNPLARALGQTRPYYSVAVAGLTFLMLDANNPTAEQLAWLRDLPADRPYIPVFHQPPYPTISGHGADAGVLRDFVPEFRRLGVKLSFNGHNHGYDRAEVGGITYATAGGGGAPLYPCGRAQSYTKFCTSDYGFVKCQVQTDAHGTTVSCSAVRRGNQVIDTFAVTY